MVVKWECARGGAGFVLCSTYYTRAAPTARSFIHSYYILPVLVVCKNVGGVRKTKHGQNLEVGLARN